MKKRIRIIAVALLTALALQNTAFAQFEWAMDSVRYCVNKGIIAGDKYGNLNLDDGLTREQMARILVDAFGLSGEVYGQSFRDVPPDRWSYSYVERFKGYMKNKGWDFNPEMRVTREEFASSLVLASGLKESNIRNSDILDYNYWDFESVDPSYKKLMCIAVERGYYKGADCLLRPKDFLTRAEACSLLYRVLASKEGLITLDLGVIPSRTNIIGPAQVSVDAAKAWAQRNGAAQRFIDIADLYWKYGDIMGVRPEIMYAQAAKETGFGKYGGAVVPEQNNWAGIKTRYATGDTTYDHETFATPEDGVRGHYNHIGAYIGLAPLGEPHGRYYSVKSLAWAGTVVTLEELGGKWCPDLYYGYSILHRYIEKM